jgi:hypothetical protein
VSLEFLILLAAFVLLPLIQQLLQAARQGAPPAPAPAPAEVPPLRRPRTPRHAREPADATLPLLEGAGQALRDALTAHGPTPAGRTASPATLALAAHRGTRRLTAAPGLHGRLDLRRAIVLMAMLEPCRAVNPFEGPEGIGRP